ncbi:MAG: hypothetical protein GY765_34840 [bacterium]|nr:hypothetical protein [bacterium]
MIRSLDQLVSGLSVKRKISLLTFILVIPLFLIITIALSLLGARLHDSIRSNMADSRQSVINAFSFFRKQTTTYAGLIAAHYNVRRGVYFSNTGMILQYAAPVLKETQLDFIIVHDRNRVILCRAHAPDDFNIDDRNNRAVGLALEGKSSWAVEPHEKDIVLRTTVPVYHLTTRGFIVGAVTVGYKMNNSFAEELKKVGGVDVLFVEDEFIFASSFGNLLQLPESLAANSFVRKIAGVSFDISRIPVNSPVIENLKIVVAGDNSAITIAFTRILWGIGILFLLTAGASLLLSLKIGGNITASTGTILKSTEEISRRNYDIDIRLDTRDEFKTLADTYNVMATNIKGSFNTIREQTREIETLKNFLSNIIESMPPY